MTEIKIPEIFYSSGVLVDDAQGVPVFNPDYRIFIIKGGRGGGKSHTICGILVLMAAVYRKRVLCTREIQNSIGDSVLKLLTDKVDEYDLQNYYTVQKSILKSKTGSEFLFKGLLRNIRSIKSGEGYDIAFTEEAETVSKESLDLLIPTIRKKNSQLIFAFNPEREGAPVEELSNRPDAITLHVNYTDNPFCSEELIREAELCRRVKPDDYDWIWLGKHRQETDALIFKGKIEIAMFDEPEDKPMYQGLDFGFNPDPTAFVRCFEGNDWQGNKGKYLFVSREIYEIMLLPINIHLRCNELIPNVNKYETRADSSRNDSIEIVKINMPYVVGASRGPGSIKNGIEFLLGYDKIIIHARCKNTADEFKTYSYKTDSVTRQIIPVPEDKNNHLIDALRYATESLWHKKTVRVIDVRGVLG